MLQTILSKDILKLSQRLRYKNNRKNNISIQNANDKDENIFIQLYKSEELLQYTQLEIIKHFRFINGSRIKRNKILNITYNSLNNLLDTFILKWTVLW